MRGPIPLSVLLRSTRGYTVASGFIRFERRLTKIYDRLVGSIATGPYRSRNGLCRLLIASEHEYHLPPIEGVPADCPAPELLACRGAALHHAVGHERAGARAGGPARLPAVRPH